MFDALTDKLQGVFSGLKGRGKLTDADIDKAMRAIRLSLLEADVSLPVVKQQREPRDVAQSPDGHPYGGAPGVGEDHLHREAGPASAE